LRRLRAIAAAFAVLTLAAPYALADPPIPSCLEPLIPCPKPAPAPQPAPQPKPRDLTAYHGLGTWLDAYDFSREYGGKTKPTAVDDMAAQGVKTLYIQAAKDKNGGGTGVLSADLLGQFLERAHAKKMRVVAWYLPRFVDASRDWAHVDAMLKFSSHGQRFDSVGIDIESREEGNVDTRNQRLISLSTKLRQAAGSMSTSAIVVPPVVTDVINPKYWPNFPWAKIKSSYDVWLPMSYYTNRTKQPEWRDAYKYSSENVKRLRQDLGLSGAPVHVIGGVGTDSTSKDYDGLVRAAKDTKCVGASSYDYGVTAKSAWATLRKSPT
jgi:hypothetical protein